MANIHGIEVSGSIYDIEDESARSSASEAGTNASEAKTAAQTATNNVTTLSNTVSNLVLQTNGIEDKVGDVDTPLDTTAQTLVGAVNELNSKGGAVGYTLKGFQKNGTLSLPQTRSTQLNEILAGFGMTTSELEVGQGYQFIFIGQELSSSNLFFALGNCRKKADGTFEGVVSNFKTGTLYSFIDFNQSNGNFQFNFDDGEMDYAVQFTPNGGYANS